MRLIDADDLAEHKFVDIQDGTPIEVTSYNMGWNDALECVMEYETTIEAEPVRHGIWEMGTGLATCSVCKQTPLRTYIYDSQYWRYCPMCGAKMVGTDYVQPEWEPNE